MTITVSRTLTVILGTQISTQMSSEASGASVTGFGLTVTLHPLLLVPVMSKVSVKLPSLVTPKMWYTYPGR